MGNGFIHTTNLAQFNNLIQELIQGGPKRAVFQKWELDLLLDFETCRVRRSARPEVLRRYQRTVQQYFLRGQYAFPPLSVFLAEERARRSRARTAVTTLAPAEVAPAPVEQPEEEVVAG
jgi:hypothetical protein